VSGDLAFVADLGGLKIIDISDPTSPAPLGDYIMPDEARDVTVSGDLAFVANSASGLQIIDISNPDTPTLAGTYDTEGNAYGVAVAGDLAFVADYANGLQIIQVLQDEVVLADNAGRSLAVDGADDLILKTRVTSTQSAGVSWELSADGGGNFEPVTPGADWTAFATSGTDLVWRSTHTWAPGINPTVSDVTVEWLNEFALVASVTDIPNDQGRQVRVEWTRSGRDFVGDPQQIVEYAVYRKIDPDLSAVNTPGALRAIGDLRESAREHALAMPAAGWHFITTVPVSVEDSYAVVVPTLADSTIAKGKYMTSFMIRAFTATPGVYFDSPPDSGYSLDNLAPSVPANFSIAHNTGSGNSLSWDEAPEADFQYFRVYRSTNPDFVPEPGSLVYSTTSTGWVDPDNDGGTVYYKVTSTDLSGNESDAASAGTVTSVPRPVVPASFALYQNIPNPFNPTTTIRYDVARRGGVVTLQVFDVSGRLVRTLVDQAQGEGYKDVTWDGRNEAGQPVATGMYFYRLSAPGFTQTRKMVLLK
jgi:hypothetical protein